MRITDAVSWLIQQGAGRTLVGFERLRSGATYNPFDKRLRSDPFPLYRRLRERDPVHRSALLRGWVLSRYDDALAVLSDRRFSSDDRNDPGFERMMRRARRVGLLDAEEEIPASMLRSDPPVHTRLRRLVSKAFTPRQIRKLEPRIEAIVHEHLDRAVAGGRSELEIIGDLAYPLPVIVIAEMLGVPAEDRERFKQWSDEIVLGLGFQSLADARRSRAAGRALTAYLASIAEQRRREPHDDLISGLILAEEEGDKLTMEEVYSICTLILVAGHETTTKLIGNGLLALLESPEQHALLRDDPARVDGAVEEMLRFCGPVQATARIATESIELGGVTVQKGQTAFLLLAAANRDPDRFPDPDRFDIQRGEEAHLAFGQGLHFCLGANLARLETRMAVRALVERFPDLRLGDEPPVWGKNLILRGPERLTVRV